MAVGAKPQPAGRAAARRHGSRPWPRRAPRSRPARPPPTTTAAEHPTRHESRCSKRWRRLWRYCFPHLEREEHETMPLVSVSITAAEWHAVDQQYFIKPKSLSAARLRGPLAARWARLRTQPDSWCTRYRRSRDSSSSTASPVAIGGGRRPAGGRPDGTSGSRPDVVRPGRDVATPDPAYRARRHRRRRTDRRGVERRDRRDPRRRMEPRMPSRRMARRCHRSGARGALSRHEQGGSLDVEPHQRSPRRRRTPHVRVANRAHAPVSRQQRVAHSSSSPSTAGRASRSRSRSSAHPPCSRRCTRSSFPPIAIARPASPTTCAGSASSRPRSKDRDW